MNLNWDCRVIGASSPDICLLFMPNMLAMNASGNYAVKVLDVSESHDVC